MAKRDFKESDGIWEEHLNTIEGMFKNPTSYTRCLKHQCNEDQMSQVGLVCSQCKRELYTNAPSGSLMAFWESQPVAYTLDRQPCFVYTLVWENFRIRSLHPAQSESDARAERVAKLQGQQAPAENWLDDFLAKFGNSENMPELRTEQDDDQIDYGSDWTP